MNNRYLLIIFLLFLLLIPNMIYAGSITMHDSEGNDSVGTINPGGSITMHDGDGNDSVGTINQ